MVGLYTSEFVYYVQPCCRKMISIKLYLSEGAFVKTAIRCCAALVLFYVALAWRKLQWLRCYVAIGLLALPQAWLCVRLLGWGHCLGVTRRSPGRATGRRNAD